MSYKKWVYKYKYLQVEFEEVKHQKDKYLKEFERLFTFKDKKPSQTVKDAIEESNKPKPKVPKQKNTKNLYKKLSKKVHPDRGGSNEEFVELNELYEEGDLLGMITKAEDYDIDTTEFKEDKVELEFEHSCWMLEEKTKEMQQTLAWKWGTAQDKDKQGLKQMFEHMYGLIPKEDI
tara:strand:- start:264 stop:791 length:528 start_codon:yes stop_codon:yes gene_type:complete